MKIAALSDLHGNFPKIESLLDQEIDLLLVVGDIAGGSHLTNAQYKSMTDFFKWVDKINPGTCIITPGNHDYWDWGQLFKYRERPKNTYCLIDQHREVDGLIVHGTPWSIEFLGWNYMKEDERLAPHWENIHPDTDILINHGPAYGLCDSILTPAAHDKRPMQHHGSKSLYNELLKRNIPRVLTGHIHGADHGDVSLGKEYDTLCSCVSILDEEYKFKHEPKIFEM